MMIDRIGLRKAAIVVAAAVVISGPIQWLSPHASTLYAQNANATVRGQITDPDGALIPNATVTLVNQDTGIQVFTGITDASGIYVAPQVGLGTYRLTVTAPGLKTKTISSILATASATVTADVQMEVGASSEEVNVTATAVQLDRNTSDVSTLISPNEVKELPLSNRTTENLLVLIPGVTHGGSATNIYSYQLSINGSRTLNTEVLLNGTSVVVGSTGNILTLPSPDGIDQLRMLSSTAPAEYGRTSGAVLSTSTRSGTNDFHGTIYSLIRNEAMNANTYFNKLASLSRPRQRYYQIGASLGGPVVIPHLYDGHNKLFFFINYDKTIQNVQTTLTSTVPDAAKRAGNFSGAQTVYRPGGTSTAAYANNLVTNINAAASKIMAMIPLPNTVGTYDAANNRYTNNWVQQQKTQPEALRLAARVDGQAGSHDRVNMSLYRFNTLTPQTVSFGVPLLNSNYDCSCENAWVASVGDTHIFSSKTVLDLNYGYFRDGTFRNPPGTSGSIVSDTGISSLPLGQFPTISYTSYTGLGATTNAIQSNINNTFMLYGTLTQIIGAHTLRAGASLRKNQFNAYNPSGYPNGQINFDGTMTNHGNAGNATTALADFLTGNVATANYTIPMPVTGRRNYNMGFFVQDDWKATPQLSINAGIRYEFEAPVTVANNIYSRIDPSTGTLLVAGSNASRSLDIITPKANISPRFGFAYSADSKTVVRGAFGTYYGTIFQNLGGQVAFPGYEVAQTFSSKGTAVPQSFSLSDGIPLTGVRDLSNPAAALATGTLANPYTPSGMQYQNQSPMPLTQQWSLGIQRELPLGLLAELNYIGNHGLHLPQTIKVNVVPLSSVDAVTLANTTTAAQQARPLHTISSYTTVQNVGNSSYHGLQASVKRQFGSHFALMTNYTFGKAMDDGSTLYNYSAPNGSANAQYSADAAQRRRDWAVGSLNVKHSANIALQYTTSGPFWLRDWNISPLFSVHSGLPLNITQTNEITDAEAQRPNGIPAGVKLASPHASGKTAVQWLRPATDANFALTPSGPIYATVNGTRTRIVPMGFGTLGRNSIEGPSLLDLNLSVSKTFSIWRELKFQLRADAFNVINHTNFQPPSTTLTVGTSGTTASFATSSTSFGQITSTWPQRQLQLVGRFSF